MTTARCGELFANLPSEKSIVDFQSLTIYIETGL